MTKFLKTVQAFATDEEGAQIVEYALIIAMVSIVLAGLLATAFGTDPASTDPNMFEDFVGRIRACLGVGAAGATCQ